MTNPECNPNNPAFTALSGFREIDGLTKRELFAFGAMIGMMAGRYADIRQDRASKQAVELADALIEALNSTKQDGK